MCVCCPQRLDTLKAMSSVSDAKESLPACDAAQSPVDDNHDNNRDRSHNHDQSDSDSIIVMSNLPSTESAVAKSPLQSSDSPPIGVQEPMKASSSSLVDVNHESSATHQRKAVSRTNSLQTGRTKSPSLSRRGTVPKKGAAKTTVKSKLQRRRIVESQSTDEDEEEPDENLHTTSSIIGSSGSEASLSSNDENSSHLDAVVVDVSRGRCKRPRESSSFPEIRLFSSDDDDDDDDDDNDNDNDDTDAENSQAIVHFIRDEWSHAQHDDDDDDVHHLQDENCRTQNGRVSPQQSRAIHEDIHEQLKTPVRPCSVFVSLHCF